MLNNPSFDIIVDTPRPSSTGAIHVEAGGRLEGRLIIEAKRRVRAKGLTLCLHGKEYTRFVIHTAQGTRVINDQAEILGLDIPLDTSSIFQQGKLVPGYHELPFACCLPRHIPSSMQAVDKEIDFLGRFNTARIAYTLKAVLDGSGLFKNKSAKFPVKVLAQAKHFDASPYQPQPQARKVTSLSFSKGEVTLQIAMVNTDIARGETVWLQLVGINDSYVGVRSIKIAVQQEINRRPSGHSFTPLTLSSKTFKPPQNLRRSRGKQELRRRLLMENRYQENYQQLAHQLEANDPETIYVLPPIPRHACDTYKGRTFTVKHVILITLVTNSICSSNPVYHVPVNIAREEHITLSPPAGTRAQPLMVANASLVGTEIRGRPLMGAASMVSAESNVPLAMAEPIYDLDQEGDGDDMIVLTSRNSINSA